MGGCAFGLRSQCSVEPGKEQATDTLPCASRAIARICCLRGSCASADTAVRVKSSTRRIWLSTTGPLTDLPLATESQLTDSACSKLADLLAQKVVCARERSDEPADIARPHARHERPAFSGDNDTVLMRGLQNLLATQDFHGNNRGGAVGGKKAGDSGCGEEQQCCVEKDQRVACADFGPVRHKLCGVEAE